MYASVQQVAQAPKSLEALEQAVAKGGKTGVEDADKVLKTLIETKAGSIIKQIDEGAPASQFTKRIYPDIVSEQGGLNIIKLRTMLSNIQNNGLNLSSMGSDIQFWRFSDSKLLIQEGHHRIVAISLLDLKLPLKNHPRVKFEDLPFPSNEFPGGLRKWVNMVWE